MESNLNKVFYIRRKIFFMRVGIFQVRFFFWDYFYERTWGVCGWFLFSFLFNSIFVPTFFFYMRWEIYMVTLFEVTQYWLTSYRRYFLLYSYICNFWINYRGLCAVQLFLFFLCIFRFNWKIKMSIKLFSRSECNPNQTLIGNWELLQIRS